MSPSIWTQCEGPSRTERLDVAAWRVVEAQHQIATRKLVDSLDEQALLEEIVDGAKPTAPTGAGFDGLHYLLSTPFRYPPLPRGSRFGGPLERNLWYGAARVETSLAEKSYYQLLFRAGTKADLTGLGCDWTAFQAQVAAHAAVDLTRPPWARFEDEISSPTSYASSQALGRDMRAAGVVGFAFTSARCPDRGKALGLFAPAFSAKAPGPSQMQTWRCLVTDEGCEVFALNSSRAPLVFPRRAFERAGTLPAPALVE